MEVAVAVGELEAGRGAWADVAGNDEHQAEPMGEAAYLEGNLGFEEMVHGHGVCMLSLLAVRGSRASIAAVQGTIRGGREDARAWTRRVCAGQNGGRHVRGEIMSCMTLWEGWTRKNQQLRNCH